MGVLRHHFGGPKNVDYGILGSVVGSLLRKLTYRVMQECVHQ